MPVSIRQRLTYANVMSTLAFFVAIGGTTLAATKIDGGTIEKGSIPGKAIKNSAIKAKKVGADTLTGGQINESSLGQVPTAATAGSAATADSADTAGSAATADSADNAATVGGLSAAQLTDSCPATTTAYAGVCIETAARTPSATWPTAAKDCADDGGRLPGIEELEAYRRLSGVTIGSEFTSSYYDANELATDGAVVIVMDDSGLPLSPYDYNDSFAIYRCVFPLTNSG